MIVVGSGGVAIGPPATLAAGTVAIGAVLRRTHALHGEGCDG